MAAVRREDAIVIGAGVIGCAVAYELARRDVKALVIDARGVGGGATQASAGLLAPYIEGHHNPVLRQLGARSLKMYDAFVERVVAESGRGVRYGANGTLEVATDEEATRRLQASSRALADDGVRHRVLDRRETREIEPLVADDVAGSRVIDDHRFVAAAELTSALAGAAERLGARVEPGNTVSRIVQSGSTVAVETGSNRFEAPAAVLAAGSWSGQIEIGGADAAPVRPVRGQLLYLRWRGVPLRRATWGAACYLVPWGSESLLVGATVEEVGFDERVTVAGVRDLLEAACAVVPAAWQAGFADARVGLRPATPDDLPIVGTSGRVNGLVYATGHYRNGVLLAPLTASLVADLVTGHGDAAPAALAPQRFGAL